MGFQPAIQAQAVEASVFLEWASSLRVHPFALFYLHPGEPSLPLEGLSLPRVGLRPLQVDRHPEIWELWNRHVLAFESAI